MCNCQGRVLFSHFYTTLTFIKIIKESFTAFIADVEASANALGYGIIRVSYVAHISVFPIDVTTNKQNQCSYAYNLRMQIANIRNGVSVPWRVFRWELPTNIINWYSYILCSNVVPRIPPWLWSTILATYSVNNDRLTNTQRHCISYLLFSIHWIGSDHTKCNQVIQVDKWCHLFYNHRYVITDTGKDRLLQNGIGWRPSIHCDYIKKHCDRYGAWLEPFLTPVVPFY